MKNLILILSLLFVFSYNASSQSEQMNIGAIDNYKYIIVPLEYDFLEEEDKYQINSLTKFLFNKYGYSAVLENETFPDDLVKNRCLALKVNVEEIKGGFLKTKLQIQLFDCNGLLKVSSKIGLNREKDYKTAYNLALRSAFETFQTHEYNYKPAKIAVALSSDSSNNSKKPNEEQAKADQKEIERLKQEVAALKEEKEVEETVETPEAETLTKKIEKPIVQEEEINLLYAQPIENGFQVVDNTPKVIMILLETPKENTFIVKDQNAIVYKEDGFWYLSKNDGKATTLETLNIKF